MKKILLFVALFVATASQAQITVTNSIFPAAGDVLERSFTNNVASVVVTAPGSSAQSWNYSFLTTDFLLTDNITDATTGLAFTQFPSTEILTPFMNLGTAYTDVNTTAMTNVGAGLEFFGMSFVSAYSNPQTLQVAPLTYGTTGTDTYAVAFAENIDSIPFLRQLIDSINPVPGVSPDSIRIRFTGNTTMVVDAFGTLQSYDATYNVLRQKTITYGATKIDMHFFAFGFSVWQDVTSYLTGQIPFPIPLTDTTYRYDYIAEGEKTPILRLNMDPSGNSVQNAEFKGNNPVGIFYTAPVLAEVQVFPNPTASVLNLRTESLGVDAFNLQLVDALGRTVLEETNVSNKIHQISVADLPQGNYFLLLRSESGTLLAREQISVKR